MKKTKPFKILTGLILSLLLVSCSEKPSIEKTPFIVEEDLPDQEKTQVEIQDEGWKTTYLDLLDYKIEETEYGDFLIFDNKINGIENILLYDLNEDGIPELFVEGGYESTCIYTIKDNKLTFLGEIIPGTITIEKNLKTNESKMFIGSLLEGDGGMFYLAKLDMEEDNIIYEIPFGKYSAFDESENEYYLNVKDRFESIDEAFMDYASREVSQEAYEKAMNDFRKSHQVIKEVIPSKAPMYNEESFEKGMELFKNTLHNYDR